MMRPRAGLTPAPHCCRCATRGPPTHSRSSPAANNVRAKVVEREFGQLYSTRERTCSSEREPAASQSRASATSLLLDSGQKWFLPRSVAIEVESRVTTQRLEQESNYNMSTGNNHLLRQAVRAALFYSGTMAAALATHTSAAQTPPASTNDQPYTAPAMTEVVVTGSRIATPALGSVSPITAVSATEIRETGTTRVEDLLNSLPQVTADQGSGLSMGSNGTATVNLRGLGIQRTLVLVNGRRLMGGDPAAGAPSGSQLSGASAADVDQIPVALLERVDVLTGGAASTYGADAVAGVVNFIMNDHFEGLRVDVNVGIYNHENHNAWIGPLLQAEGSPVPTGSNWDGANKDLTLIMGHNFADGAGNFEGYLGYRRTSPITASNRDHTACVLNNNLDLSSGASFGPYTCHGSINSAPSVIFAQDFSAVSQVASNGSLVPYYQSFNYA